MLVEPIELRSDTFTKPTLGMLEAMMQAEVGDDVFGEDPTVNHLEQKVASKFGFEAALLCLSGTMANQIAIAVHTKPGDEVICDALSHIYLYEGGGIAANSHASVRLLHGVRGMLKADMVKEAIQVDNPHYPASRLVSLENTVNKGGGACYRLEDIAAIRAVCDFHHLKLHLDGARLFNAMVAKQQKPEDFAKHFHSISVCFSKGLGAPMGSILLGSKEFIHQARRVRKRWGGGWRQAGYIAAAVDYALANHIPLLQKDHERAAKIEAFLKTRSEITAILPVETNIIIFELTNNWNAHTYLTKLAEHQIMAAPFGKQQIRLVTHLDFTDHHLDQLINRWIHI